MFLILIPETKAPFYNWFQEWLLQLNSGICLQIHAPEFCQTLPMDMISLLRELHQLDDALQYLVVKMVNYAEHFLRRKHYRSLLNDLLRWLKIYPENAINFIWDSEKYPPNLPYEKLTEKLCEQFQQLRDEIHNKNPIIEIEKSINTLKKQTKRRIKYSQRVKRSLKKKDLSEFISKDCIVDTDYIQTVFIAVRHKDVTKWEEIYETLSDGVFANSCEQITEDKHYKLYSIVIVRKDFEEFKKTCSKLNFIARTFEITSDEEKLELQIQALTIIEWIELKCNEIFNLLLHSKIFRAICVNSLQYAIEDEQFQIFLIDSNDDVMKFLQEQLTNICGKVEQEIIYDDDCDLFTYSDSETISIGYFPSYLCYRIDFSFLPQFQKRN